MPSFQHLISTSAALALALTASLASAAQLFEYKLPGFGAPGDQTGCTRALQDVAAKFAHAAGITPFSTGCREDRILRDGLEGVISYFAEERVKIITTDDWRAMTDTQGAFRSLESCQQHLSTRVDQFVAVYGVQPVAAWCCREYSSRDIFAARIEAVGESDIESVVTGFDFYGRPDREYREILIGLQRAGQEKFGDRYVDVSLGSHLAYVRATIRYYDTERYWLDNLADIKFKTEAACHAARDHVQEFWTGRDTQPAMLFCTVDGLAGIRLNVVTFTREIGKPDAYSHYQSPGTFASQEDCEGSARQVRGGNASIFGTVCTDTVPSILHLFMD